MKTTIKTGLAALLILLAISCKKENSTIQSLPVTNKNTTDAISDEVDGVTGKNSVKIGTQVWKIKNLNVSRYRNGDSIPQVKGKNAWAYLKTGAWCYYNNDPATGAIYGKLYNWYAVNDPRGLAPVGWHVPSDAEWTALSNFLGGDAVAGGKMKSTGTIEAGTGLWYAPNADATNSSGFTGLPGGNRYYDGTFSSISLYGTWWSSTENGSDYAWFRYLSYDGGSIKKEDYLSKNYGLSIRCLKD